MSNFRRVAPPQPPAPRPTRDDRVNGVAIEFMTLVLKVLGERTMALASHLFPLLALAGGFYLALQMIPAPPTNSQLLGFGIYSAFALLLELVRRRR